ncbi:MAG: hypothetical protein N2235_01450 [Fischerella sp.]|nr:hypothetical protein [Fischerella sp.]
MLIQKSNFDVGDIVGFKISNGDEVVAEVVEITPMEYKIKKPTTVVASPQGLGLMQSLFSVDPNTIVPLSKNHVIMAAPVHEKMRDHYVQTTTGIALPSRQ